MLRVANMTWREFANKCGYKGEGDIETVANILFTPIGYKFLKNNIEKYSLQIGMLNRLLKEELISEKEHSTIRNSIKRKYEIKE